MSDEGRRLIREQIGQQASEAAIDRAIGWATQSFEFAGLVAGFSENYPGLLETMVAEWVYYTNQGADFGTAGIVTVNHLTKQIAARNHIS